MLACLYSFWNLVSIEVSRIPASKPIKKFEDEVQTLLQSAQAGDREAFSSLVREHLPLVCSLLSSLTRNQADVDDLAQETFLKAWQSLPSLQSGARFKPWLCRIAVNLAHDDRRRFAPLRLAPGVPLEHLAEDASVLQQLQGQELHEILGHAVQSLPEELRLAFVLRVMEQRSYQDVAEILELKPQTIRARVARARRILMDSLNRVQEEGGES